MRHDQRRPPQRHQPHCRGRGQTQPRPDAIVVNAQGDEPELEGLAIDESVAALVKTGAAVGTAAQPFREDEDPADPNLVKVVLRRDGTAMYFSRSLIPFPRDTAGKVPPPGTSWDGVRPLKHLGVYTFRRTFLDSYSKLEPTVLERTEQLEQLRVLYHGHAIAVAVIQGRGYGGIDTPEQYEAFVKRWKARNRS